MTPTVITRVALRGRKTSLSRRQMNSNVKQSVPVTENEASAKVGSVAKGNMEQHRLYHFTQRTVTSVSFAQREYTVN